MSWIGKEGIGWADRVEGVGPSSSYRMNRRGDTGPYHFNFVMSLLPVGVAYIRYQWPPCEQGLGPKTIKERRVKKKFILKLSK